MVNELGRTRIECNVTVKSTFSSKMFALNVVVLVPVPDYTAKANILVTTGKAKYDATKKALVGGGLLYSNPALVPEFLAMFYHTTFHQPSKLAADLATSLWSNIDAILVLAAALNDTETSKLAHVFPHSSGHMVQPAAHHLVLATLVLLSSELQPAAAGVEDTQVHRYGRALAARGDHPGVHNQGAQALGAAAHCDAVPGANVQRVRPAGVVPEDLGEEDGQRVQGGEVGPQAVQVGRLPGPGVM
jgi:hypothetical protein